MCWEKSIKQLKSHTSWENPWFPADFPPSQPIESNCFPTNQPTSPKIAQVGPGDRRPGGGLGGLRPARHDPRGAWALLTSQPWMVDEIHGIWEFWNIPVMAIVIP